MQRIMYSKVVSMRLTCRLDGAKTRALLLRKDRYLLVVIVIAYTISLQDHFTMKNHRKPRKHFTVQCLIGRRHCDSITPPSSSVAWGYVSTFRPLPTETDRGIFC